MTWYDCVIMVEVVDALDENGAPDGFLLRVSANFYRDPYSERTARATLCETSELDAVAALRRLLDDRAAGFAGPSWEGKILPVLRKPGISFYFGEPIRSNYWNGQRAYRDVQDAGRPEPSIVLNLPVLPGTDLDHDPTP